MSKKVFALLMMLAGVLPSNIGRSDVIISVDMDAATPGIQSTLQGSPGATLTAGLWMQLTGATSLSVYNFSVEYDQTKLTFQSRSETPSALNGLSELDTTNANNTAAGRLFRFDGGTFSASGGPTGPFGPVKVGEIVFSTINPFGVLGDRDIEPGRFEPSFDTFFDNAGNEITAVTFIGGSFSAIPEPTTLSLLGLVFASSVFLRRRELAV